MLAVYGAGVDHCRRSGVCADGGSVLRAAVVPEVFNMKDVSARLSILDFKVVVREGLGGVGANVLIFASLLVEPTKREEGSRVTPVFDICALSSCALLRDCQRDLVLPLADLTDIYLEKGGSEVLE